MNVQEVPIGDVRPDPDQPRKTFKQSDLDDLAESIRQHGIIQPLTVVETLAMVYCEDHPGKRAKCQGHQRFLYEIVAGERRYRAALLAGLEKVPVIVRQFEDQDRKAIQILENVARADLNAIEEAEAFRDLIALGMPAETVAPKVGKSIAYVTARLSLLRLDWSLQALVRSGQMNTTTGYLLAKLEGEKQHIAAKAWLDNGLSTAALTKVVEKLSVEQDPMFSEEEAPARSADAKDARARIEAAIARAIDAVGSALDKRTLELLPEAMEGDVTFTVQRLAMLERAVASLRAEVEASAARRPRGMWDGKM